MDEQPMYYPPLSLYLSRILDEVGLNEKTVQTRRKSLLQLEKLCTTYSFLQTKDIKLLLTVYYFGSQSEGAVTPGLRSDFDCLFCTESVNVIQDWSEWQQGHINLLMLHEDTVPGYCRLQELRSDMPIPEEHLRHGNTAYDRYNRVIQGHVLPLLEGHIQNGPADSIIGDQYHTDLDNVVALRCNTWPPYAAQWIHRRRLGNWPTRQLFKQAAEDGIFLVQVGYKFSQTPDLEWRLSFSSTERNLMFSMNMTQLKCYVVLKMLMKSLVNPHAGDSISSYHCKTAMFYCMEETDSEYWREDNLVECIVKCLRLLLTWVNNEFCPHFIIPESNLFAGKITPQNKRQVQSALKDFIQSNGRFLLCIPTDNLGQMLHIRLGARPNQYKSLDSQQTMEVVCCVLHSFILFINNFRTVYLVKCASLENMYMQHVYQSIDKLCTRRAMSDPLDKQAIHGCLQFLSVFLGSMLASVSLSNKQRISREAIHLLSFTPRTDTSLLLKLASIFYCNRDLHKTESILTEVAGRYHRNIIMTLCICYNQAIYYSNDFALQFSTVEDEDARAALFACCVRFSPHERYCAPPALRHEFYRSVGDDILHRDPEEDEWMVLAAVDCLPFLYYLQYLTYGELGKRVLQKEALQSLEDCLFEDECYGHLETGWNLLGQCMEQEEKLEDAMRCYRTSLEIRSRNNAANWHVQHLRYQSIRTGRSITETE